jgi:hypothetical protein
MLPGDGGTALRCHSGAVERLGHAAHGREAAFTGGFIGSAAKWKRRPRGVTGVISSSPPARVFHRTSLSTHPEHKLGRRQHESRRNRSSTVRWLRWQSDLPGSTVPSKNLFRVSDRQCLGRFFSQFLVITHVKLYRKIVE